MPSKRPPTVCTLGRDPHVTHQGAPACKGHKKPERGGGCCRQAPLVGLDVCKFHGGGNPTAKAAGQRREQERRTEEIARKLIPDLADRDVIHDPLARLLELASEADAFRESLRVLSNKLDDRIRYGSTLETEQLRAEVSTYRAALGDVTSLLIAIAKLDIDTRLANITAVQVTQTMDALRAGCDHAGLDEETRRKVMAGVGRHLRSVAS